MSGKTYSAASLGVAHFSSKHRRVRRVVPICAREVTIAKSLDEQVGPGRGSLTTPDSSLYLIARDPFRAIRRGRQLFQRKFTRAQDCSRIAPS